MRKLFGQFGFIEHCRWGLTQKIHAFRHGHVKSATWDINGWFLDNIIELLDAFIDNPYLSSPMIYDEKDEFVADENWRDKLILMRYGFARYKAVCEDMVGYSELKEKYFPPEDGKTWNTSFRAIPVDPPEEIEGMGQVVYRYVNPCREKDPERYEEFQDAWLEEEKKAKMALDRSLKMFAEHFLDLWD